MNQIKDWFEKFQRWVQDFDPSEMSFSSAVGVIAALGMLVVLWSLQWDWGILSAHHLRHHICIWSCDSSPRRRDLLALGWAISALHLCTCLGLDRGGSGHHHDAFHCQLRCTLLHETGHIHVVDRNRVDRTRLSYEGALAQKRARNTRPQRTRITVCGGARFILAPPHHA